MSDTALARSADAQIRAADVRTAFEDANPNWTAPSADALERLAFTLSLSRAQRLWRVEIRHRIYDGCGKTRMQHAEKVRAAIGTILRELPDLAEHSGKHVSSATDHTKCLSDLLDAAKRTARLWPSLDGSSRNLDPRNEWALAADSIASPALWAWQQANPEIKIGMPLSTEQPATRLIGTLLEMIGYTVAAWTISKHFNRDKMGLVILQGLRHP